jgi:hypothetical protein
MRWQDLLELLQRNRLHSCFRWPAPFWRRKRNRRFSLGAAREVMALEDRTMLSMILWDGGGGDFIWGNPLNWDSDILPGAEDDVVIDNSFVDVSGITITVGVETGDVVVNRVQSEAGLRVLQSASITVAADSSFERGVSLSSSGRLDGAGDITLSGSSFFSSNAVIEGSGRLTIASGASFTAKDIQHTRLSRVTDVFGTLTVGTAPSGTAITHLTLDQSGDQIIVHPGATLHLKDTALIASSTGARIVNQGTVLRSGAGIVNITAEFVNQADMDLVEGELRLNGGGSTTTSIDVQTDATLRFDNSFEGFDFASGTALTGEGTILFFGSFAVYDFSDALFLPTGTVEFRSGTTTIANTLPAELSIPIMSGTVIFNADQTLDGITYLLATVRGSGDLAFTGNSLLNGLTLEGTGTATIAPGADMSIGGFNATFRRSVENFGRLRTNANVFRIDEQFINRPGAEFVLGSGGALFANLENELFLNEGTFSKVGEGLGRVGSRVDLQNTGSIVLDQGELRLEGSGSTTTSINVPADATLRFNAGFEFGPGTALTGDGTVLFFGSSLAEYDFSDAEFLLTGTVEFRSGGTTTIANTLPAELSIPIMSGTVIFNADQILDSVRYELVKIQGSGDLTFTGSSLLNGLRLEGTGTATITSGANMRVGGSNAFFRRSVENFGTLRTNSNRVLIDEPFINRPGAEFVLGSGGTLSADLENELFLNEGTFSKVGEGLGQVFSRVELQNTGSIVLEQGELRLEGGGSTTTSIDVPTGATLNLRSSFDFTSPVALTGDGRLEFSGGTYDFTGSDILLTGSATFTSGTITIANTLPAELQIDQIRTNVTFNADQTLNSVDADFGRIDGSGNLTFLGDSRFNQSTVGGSGTLTVAENATVNIFSSGATFNRPVENLGLTRTFGTARFLGGIVNHAGATFEAAFGSNKSLEASPFLNHGTLIKSGLASANFLSGGSFFDSFFDNRGEIKIEAGELRLAEGSTTTFIDVPVDTTLAFTRTFEFAPGTELAGEGSVIFQGNAEYDFSDAEFLLTGTVQFSRFGAGDPTITIANTLPSELTVTLVSAVMVFNADQTLDSVRFDPGSRIQGSGDVTLTGETIFNGFSWEGTGAATIAPGAEARVFGNNATFRRSVENFGTVDVGGNRLTIEDEFINHPIAIVSVGSGATISTSTATFTNAGTLNKSGTSATTFFPRLVNTGTVTVATGELRLNAPPASTSGRFDLFSGTELSYPGVFELPTGGVLTGTGTVNGDVANGGIIEPAGINAGTLTINGNYTQTAQGQLQIDLGESSDRLNVLDSAILDGILSVSLLESFSPAEGDQFLVLSYPTHAGNFAAVSVPDLTDPLVMRVDVGADAVTLRAAANLPPDAFDDLITTLEDTASIVFEPLANDVDPDGDPLTITTIQTEGNFGNLIDLGEGRFQYVPLPDAFGRDTLLYFVTDGFADPVPATIVVEISPVNDAPVANPDVLGMAANTVLPIAPEDLLANDTDVDSSELSLADFTQPAHGSLVLDSESGDLVYTPNTDFVGTDEFTYRATDGLAISEPATVEIVVAAGDGASPDAVRETLNEGIEHQRNTARDYEAGLQSDTGGLPFAPAEAGPLGNLLSLGDALDELTQSLLTTINQTVTTFEQLRGELEQAGFAEVRVAGDADLNEGEFVRFRFTPEPIDVAASLSTASLAGTPLAALAEGTDFSGGLDLAGQLLVDLGFGVDQSGFFVTADSSITTDLVVNADVRGDLDIFGVGIGAVVRLAPRIVFDGLDVDNDQRLDAGELAAVPNGLGIEIGPIDADLTFDATLGFLDYVDVDPALPNRPHGGDPFIVRATASLSAQPSQFDAADFAGLDLEWSRVRALNPDINSDGILDYTQEVFLKNVLHLGEDLLSGAGILDYFADVLGIDNAVAPGVPGREANELPGGKLPDVLEPLADERAAVEAIDETVRLLIVGEDLPPSPERIIFEQKIHLRDWFLAEADDDVTREEEKSVQFRIAQIARVLGPTIVADELVN